MARKRHFLKPVWAALLSAALLAAPVAAAEPSGETEAQGPVLAIYTTGDMAGRVYRQDPLTGERVAAGYQNVASAMEQEREQVDAALLLDSGDAVDNGLVQDGGAAEALALRAIGYDALVPAVGEFRLGPEARDDFFAALGEASEDGAPVRVLSGNYLDEDTQSPEEDAYEVFTVELGRRAVRIGVLGLGAMEAPEELPESFVSGVRFAHRDNTSGSYSWEWTGYWQERLEKENCPNPDEPASCFGELMAQLLVYREDMWAKDLGQMGFSLGRFIYLLDAAADYDKDKRKGKYNPYLAMGMERDEKRWEEYLVLAMGRCAERYEKLPLVQDKALLDNILYSGVWVNYRGKRKEEAANDG